MFALGVAWFIDDEFVLVEPLEEPVLEPALDPELEPEPLAALAIAAPSPTAAPVSDSATRAIRSRFHVRIAYLLSPELAMTRTVNRRGLRAR